MPFLTAKAHESSSSAASSSSDTPINISESSFKPSALLPSSHQEISSGTAPAAGKHEARAAELVKRAKEFNDAPSLVCLASMYQVFRRVHDLSHFYTSIFIL
jgi:hypothetical protein